MIDWSLREVLTEYFWDLEKIKASLPTKIQYEKYKHEADTKLIKRYENVKIFCLSEITLHEMKQINYDVGFNLISESDIKKKTEEI